MDKVCHNRATNLLPKWVYMDKYTDLNWTYEIIYISLELSTTFMFSVTIHFINSVKIYKTSTYIFLKPPEK